MCIIFFKVSSVGQSDKRFVRFSVRPQTVATTQAECRQELREFCGEY